jgi:hypothetical protein
MRRFHTRLERLKSFNKFKKRVVEGHSGGGATDSQWDFCVLVNRGKEKETLVTVFLRSGTGYRLRSTKVLSRRVAATNNDDEDYDYSPCLSHPLLVVRCGGGWVRWSSIVKHSGNNYADEKRSKE